MAITYATYKYPTKEDLLKDLETLGYEFDGELSQGHLIDTATGEKLDYVFWETIATNLPSDNPIMSTDCYIHSARIGNTKLPSNKKLKNNERKYFNNYINRFAGQPIAQ